jgi:signal transduction histidine kinase
VAGHDLAEPVSLVVGFAERLAGRWEALDLEPRDREFVAFTTAAATRLQVMVDSLAEYLKACTEPFAVEPLVTSEVMDDALGALTRLTRDTGATVSCDLPEVVVADRYALTTTLRLLVHNSLTYTRAGVTPVVDVSAVRDGDRWLVRVADNGVGVDPRDTERVFRPFKHLSDQDSRPGCGMGLAICRQLVRRHGGDIALHPGERSGCVVELSLPVLEEPAR